LLDNVHTTKLDFGTMNSVAAATLALCVLAATCPPGLQAQAKTLETLFHQGTEALGAGNLDQAAQDFSAAAKMNPSFAEASFNLGLIRM
jgi:outer membrane protein assembly factor BamD (BamD/ComL family)